MATFRWPVSYKMGSCPGGLCTTGKARFCTYDTGEVKVTKLCSICSRERRVENGEILKGETRTKPKNEDIDPYFARRKASAQRKSKMTKKGKGVLGKF